ncbi:unnamed protein product [Closterium sp. Naga37s-1]|nr:unnamed protein product [Closterium sp. Naga37s-1]
MKGIAVGAVVEAASGVGGREGGAGRNDVAATGVTATTVGVAAVAGKTAAAGASRRDSAVVIDEGKEQEEQEEREEREGEEAEEEQEEQEEEEQEHGQGQRAGSKGAGDGTMRHDKAGTSRVLWLLDQMERVGIEADADTYRLALHACCLDDLVGHAKPVGMGSPKGAGLPPDAFAWRTALVTCAKANETASAIKVFEDMVETGVRANAVAYGALLSALEKGDLLEPAEAVWGHMRKMGVEPNRQAYTTMIVALGKRGEYGRAAALFEELQGTASSGSSSSISGGSSSSEAALSQQGEAGEELVAVRVHSRQDGTPAPVAAHRERHLGADVAAFNAMVTACAHAGEGLRALDWLQKMEVSSATPPNATTYQQAAIALADASHWEAALPLIPRARSRGIEPTPLMFEVVQRACAANGVVFASQLAVVSNPRADLVGGAKS